MDDFTGFDYSWAGFIDYIQCYHVVEPLWIIAGAAIFVGTVIGLVPQVYRIVRLKSSYGISPFYVLITSISQILVVLNIWCLHSADFYGMLQISLTRTLPRQLTFGNLFILWVVYLPIVALVYIFFDKKIRHNRNADSVKREWKLTVTLSGVLILITFSLFLPMIILQVMYGCSSKQVINYGKGIGIASTFVTFLQYLPQFITTCKLKDNGSFSLVTLGIQAPGGTLNFIFMMVGNGEDWTTWLSTFSCAVQQWLLLGLCIYYKLRQRYYRLNSRPLINNDQSTGSVPTINDSDYIKIPIS
ncbi:PQ loop repeat family protein [Tritrichomonas foetus]|uniref:PQ loop repeat family protein n=1 Tax=Tritrichomonas foetus TaxID=1144522 RepID=A0A1J4K5T3_9EUKA|nr:PQ loop repeat family protein [Tritrichomonas foetus]|eukprot:OHT06523.1 PQ loop repeat family protein [Tritrichomonas foetus]